MTYYKQVLVGRLEAVVVVVVVVVVRDNLYGINDDVLVGMYGYCKFQKST